MIRTNLVILLGAAAQKRQANEVAFQGKYDAVPDDDGSKGEISPFMETDPVWMMVEGGGQRSLPRTYRSWGSPIRELAWIAVCDSF